MASCRGAATEPGATVIVARAVRTGLSLALASVCAVPLASVFTHPDFGVGFKTLIVVIAALGATLPVAGVVALCVFLPISVAIHVLIDATAAGVDLTDAWLLAFLCGASVRVGHAAICRPTRLGAAALVLMTAVVTSTVVEFAALQAVVPRQPLLRDFWHYLTTNYWIDWLDFPVAHLAIRWVIWLLVAIYVEYIVRHAPRRADVVWRMWLLGGCAGACIVIARIAEVLVRAGAADGPTALALLRGLRLSVLHSDLNAAGSYFALFLVPAFVVAARGRHWATTGAVPLLLIAFAVARSRAAMGAVVLVLVVVWGRAAAASRRVTRLLMVGGAAAVVIASVVAFTARSNVALPQAIEVRVDLSRVALKTIARNPIFGVGLADYVRLSRLQMTADMPLLLSFAPNGENAHNNFLQLAAELGVPAVLVLLLLVGPVAALGWRATSTPVVTGMAMGLSAFLFSACLGHPFLIPLVGAGFFLALGVTSGLALPAPPLNPIVRGACWALAAFYAVSLVWRL